MNILGISAYFHDSSAALWQDGRLVATAAEERFSLQKHDSGYPTNAIDFCLARAGLTARDLDRVVFYEEPHVKFTRVLSSAFASFPYSRKGFVRAMKAWMGSRLWVKNEISRRLNLNPARIECVPHHLSHAAQAFAASGFDEAAVLIVDAVGEWGSTSLFRADWSKPSFLELEESVAYPHSLGLVYAAFTAFLGFRVNDSECSTMALAAFGLPRYEALVREVIKVRTDGTYRIDPSYFAFDALGDSPFSPKFHQLFGEPRGFKEPVPFHSWGKNGPVSAVDQRYADIAASVQFVLEETLLGLCRKLQLRTGSENLCFAGGVALNCVAVRRLQRESGFRRIFVPPDPGDGGAAVGAALYAAGKKTALWTPYLGADHDEARDLPTISAMRPEFWARHRATSIPQAEGLKLKTTTYETNEETIPEVVEALRAGKIVGWFQGRFENGPRALGNRSLLVDPRNLDAANRLSQHVKKRAGFRPYALSMTEKTALDLLEPEFEGASRLNHWMQTSQKVSVGKVDSVRAAVHVDGTTRPQICASEENPLFHRLLESFGEATGSAALLNTSFNDSGFPLVNTPAEAVLMFARTEMDVLVLNRTVLKKEIL